MQSIKTYETRNNTYHITRIPKTSYEQQQEHKEEFKYMLIQKSIGIIATILSIIMIWCGAIPALLLTIVGIALIFTDEHAITI